MKFLIVSHVIHKKIGNQFFAYGPYVKEMNLWLKHVSEVIILAPMFPAENSDPIDLPYVHPQIRLIQTPDFNLLTWPSRIKTLIQLPGIFSNTIVQMNKADHIHLRCPGNMGLVGCVAQIFFPSKKKSAKYAGNWDPKSSQPATFRWQRKILASEFWTKNMQVLVYGKWEPKSKNLLSFFTASYTESDKLETLVRSLTLPLRLIFVGSLHSGKNPLISCQAVKMLLEDGISCHLDLYGEGQERFALEEFIRKNNLSESITLHGNVDANELKMAYSNSHFLLFASESEGWPKAVAEAMFWACLPLTTAVSCVPQMLGEGSRGDLVGKDSRQMANRMSYYLDHPEIYRQKATQAMNWSREFTLEKFESEIKKVLLS